MKKIFKTMLTLMLVVAIAISTSGCLLTGPWYLVKEPFATEKHKQLILSLLSEKYGEEFVIRTIETKSSGGGGNGVPNFDSLFDFSGRYISYHAICSPKANEEIIFEASIATNGSKVNEEYPHAVIKHLIKEEVENVISKYSDNYALDIYFRKPSEFNCEDKEWGREFLNTVTPFTKASDITIESYSEKYLETAKASIYIAFEGNGYASIEKTEEIIEHFTSTFHKMHVRFIFLFTSKEEIDRCNALLADPTESVLLLTEIKNSPVIRFETNKGTDYKIIFDKELSKLSP